MSRVGKCCGLLFAPAIELQRYGGTARTASVRQVQPLRLQFTLFEMCNITFIPPFMLVPSTKCTPVIFHIRLLPSKSPIQVLRLNRIQVLRLNRMCGACMFQLHIYTELRNSRASAPRTHALVLATLSSNFSRTRCGLLGEASAD